MELFSSAGLEDCDRGHAKEEGEEKKKKAWWWCVCARALYEIENFREPLLRLYRV